MMPRALKMLGVYRLFGGTLLPDQPAVVRCTDKGILYSAPSGVEQQALTVLGPQGSLGPGNAQNFIPISVPAASTVIDLTLAVYLPLWQAILNGKMLTLIADGGDIRYRWSDNNVANVADPAATSTVGVLANAVWPLFNGTTRDEYAPATATGITLIGSVACILRVGISSPQGTT